MRITLVSQEYPPETAHGGIGTQTRAKAQGLAALGHAITVLSHSPDARRHEHHDGAVRVVRIPGFDGVLPIHTEPARWLTYSALVAAELAALAAESAPDLVDFPEYGAEGYVHLLNRTPWNDVPAVVHLHGPLGMLAHTLGWPETTTELYRVGTAMEAACLRLADAVYSSSRCSADWCARLYGLDAARLPILHTGVDTDHFAPGGPGEHGPTIAFVGRIAASKGADVLLDAALRMAGEVPRLRLHLIGRGDPNFVADLRARASDAGHPDLLDLPGFVPREALPAHLRRASVFAAPSRYEGGPGFVYLEAMACGLPVVACAGSGAAEVVTHEENGLLVPPDDAEALVEALRRLLSNAAERKALGASARRYAVEETDSRGCLRRIEAFYTRVAARNLAEPT